MKIVASQPPFRAVTGKPPIPNVQTKYGHLNTPLPSDPSKTRQFAYLTPHYIPPGKLAMGGAPAHYERGIPLVSVNYTKEINPIYVDRPSLYQTSTSLSKKLALKNKPLKSFVKSFE